MTITRSRSQHRLRHSLRRVAQSQIGKKLPQRKFRGTLGSSPARAMRARGFAWLAPFFAREHRGCGRETLQRSRSRGFLDRLGRDPTTIPTRAPKSSVSIWFGTFVRCAAHHFSARASFWETAGALKLISLIWCVPLCFWRGLPALPFRPDDRIDVVPVDFVADSVVTVAPEGKHAHEIYHFSSGRIPRLLFSDQRPRQSAREASAGVYAQAGMAVVKNGGGSGRSCRENRRLGDALESISALFQSGTRYSTTSESSPRWGANRHLFLSIVILFCGLHARTTSPISIRRCPTRL